MNGITLKDIKSVLWMGMAKLNCEQNGIIYGEEVDLLADSPFL